MTALGTTQFAPHAAAIGRAGGTAKRGKLRTLHILLAMAGDQDAAQVLQALRQGGFDVRHTRVANPDALHAQMQNGPWHAVIAEFRQPQWGDTQALALARATDRDLPVILICGSVGEDAAVQALRDGASDCIHITQLTARLAPAMRRAIALTRQHIRRERVRTETAEQARRLLESDAASRKMFDSIPVASMMLRPFSAITAVNEKMIELSGYSRAEMLGRTIKELGLRVEDALGEQVVRQLRRGDVVEGMEMNVRRKDGTARRVMISSQIVSISGVEQRLQSFVDLTEQRRFIDDARLVQQALASISQGVLISGVDRLTLTVNSAFESLTGYTQQELEGKPCSILQGPQTNPHTALAIRESLNSGQAYHGDILNYRKDGSSFWNALSINPVRDDDGTLTHFVGIQRNVSERRQQQRQGRLASRVFAQSREGIAITDADNRIVMVNDTCCAITGYSEADLMGVNPRAFVSTQIDDAAYAAKWQTIRELGAWQGETVGRRKDGSEYPEWLAISAIRDESGAVCNYVRTFSDLSVQQEASKRISWLSHFDPLTGLPNRNLLADRCAHDISVAGRETKTVSMLVLGIDDFKTINDTQGASAGDKLLRKFAARLSNAVREQDTVARIGGDEFVLVLPGDAPEGSSQLAERLLEVVARPYEVNDTTIAVTASIGIAVFPPDGLDFEALFKSAQLAMHDAKERGRGKHRFFNADMFQHTLELATLGAELRNAIALEQLHLHYQPFVDLQDGRVGGMEALVRWNHPTLGAVSPGRFIPVAERMGQIVAIGAWVLRQTCSDIRRWLDLGIQVPPVSVNLSPVQFRDPALAQQVEAQMKEFDIAPSLLWLELTEGALMDDMAHSQIQMQAFKALGIKLALDDFGTGYSSLSYLKRFPFDKVKIDQSFVRGVTTNSQDAVIAKVVISMARGLGLRVIAEGVETEAQCEFMRTHRCDEIQGYFFSRPIPAPALEALLRADQRLPAHLVRAHRKQHTVLLVDDAPNDIDALQCLLQADGYRVLKADSGPLGLQLLAAQPVDIIVSGQHMPGMTGVEFLRKAKAAYPKTIRVVLSDHTGLPSVTDALGEGTIYNFLTKPWHDAQLRGLIRQALSHKDLQDDNAQLSQ